MWGSFYWGPKAAVLARTTYFSLFVYKNYLVVIYFMELLDSAAYKIWFCCQCHEGWYGADCSIPSVFSSIRDWPQWLRPAHVDIPGYTHTAESINEVGALVTKKRPLIYIYDLPPEFNSHLLEVGKDSFWLISNLVHVNVLIFMWFLGAPFQTSVRK